MFVVVAVVAVAFASARFVRGEEQSASLCRVLEPSSIAAVLLLPVLVSSLKSFYTTVSGQTHVDRMEILLLFSFLRHTFMPPPSS